MKSAAAACFVLASAIVLGNVITDKYAIPPKQLKPEGKMPVIGYGTSQAKDSELEVALDSALEAGYRHIDTANIYENEKVIGKVLKRWLTSGKVKREDLFIVSKLPPNGNRPEGVVKYLKQSLADLQLEYLDLYLVHGPFGLLDVEGEEKLDKSTDHVAIWKAMEAQVDAGKAKAIGLSNFNISQITRVMQSAKIKPTNLQIELHAYHQQLPLVEFCKKHDIVVTAYAPLGSPGSGKSGQDLKNPTILNNPIVKEIAKKHEKSEAQIVLRHGLQKGLVVIPKSTNQKRLKQNLDICNFELDQDDMSKLNSLDKGDAGRLFDIAGVKDHPEYPY